MRLILAALSAMLVCGCQPNAPVDLVWREEVLLPEGQLLTAARHERIGSYGDAGYTEPRVLISTLDLFPSDAPPLPRLEVKERPVVLGYDQSLHSWFVITNVGLCDVVRAAGLGNRPYFEYRLFDGAWHQGRVGDERVGLESNLLLNKSVITDQSLVRMADKERADRTTAIPIYLRKVVSAITC